MSVRPVLDTAIARPCDHYCDQVNETQAREFRRRRRAFIRAYHPDRGGDTDLFTAGLRAFDTGREPGAGQLPTLL